MTTITGVWTHDVRFPTSLEHGRLRRDEQGRRLLGGVRRARDRRPRARGLRLHLHHRARQRPRASRRPASGRCRSSGATSTTLCRRSRCGLPRTRGGLAAALARPGEGRRAPGDGRGDERAVGSRGAPGRQAAVAAARRDDARAAGRRGRPAVPLGRAHPRRGDRRCCAELEPTRVAADRRAARARRLPVLHDERRLARLQRRQAAPPAAGGRRRRLPPRQAQGRGRTSTTTSGGCGSRAR